MSVSISLDQIVDAKVASFSKVRGLSYSVYLFLQSIYDREDSDNVKIKKIKKAAEIANTFVDFLTMIFDSKTCIEKVDDQINTNVDKKIKHESMRDKQNVKEEWQYKDINDIKANNLKERNYDMLSEDEDLLEEENQSKNDTTKLGEIMEPIINVKNINSDLCSGDEDHIEEKDILSIEKANLDGNLENNADCNLPESDKIKAKDKYKNLYQSNNYTPKIMKSPGIKTMADNIDSKNNTKASYDVAKYHDIKDKNILKETYDSALKDLKSGKFDRLSTCALYYNIPYSTLHRLVKLGDQFKGSGKHSKCLTKTEEFKIIEHLKWRAKIERGLNWKQLQAIIQQVLVEGVTTDRGRITGYESRGQLPNMSFVRRFAERNGISTKDDGKRIYLSVSDELLKE